MYYHTCPYCGANLDRTSTVTAFPVSVGNPQSGTAWTACGRVITRGLAVPALKLGSLFDGIGVFPSPRPAAGLSPRGPVRSPERRYLSPGGISRICCIWAISRR